MALLITQECINCDVCESRCPNQAIAMGDSHYIIHADRCTECVGHFEVPQCQLYCPVECIMPDPARPESLLDLQKKFQHLQSFLRVSEREVLK